MTALLRPAARPEVTGEPAFRRGRRGWAAPAASSGSNANREREEVLREFARFNLEARRHNRPNVSDHRANVESSMLESAGGMQKQAWVWAFADALMAVSGCSVEHLDALMQGYHRWESKRLQDPAEAGREAWALSAP